MESPKVVKNLKQIVISYFVTPQTAPNDKKGFENRSRTNKLKN